MSVTLQHAMATPITTPNSLDILLTKCLLKVVRLREMPASWGSVSERLECSSNITSLEADVESGTEIE